MCRFLYWWCEGNNWKADRKCSKNEKSCPTNKSMYCMIRQQTSKKSQWASKNIPGTLKLVLICAIKVVNLIKARLLNSWLLTVLCDEIGSTHKFHFLYTEVRWFSRGKFLTRPIEVLLLLTDIDEENTKLFYNDEWLSRRTWLTYLTV